MTRWPVSGSIHSVGNASCAESRVATKHRNKRLRIIRVFCPDALYTYDALYTTALWHIHGMARELTLRIIVEQPPPDVDYALQKGSGSAYERVQKQRSAGSDLVF